MAELNLVSDLALILISAGVMTLLFRRLKQPLVLGYIAAGFLISPHFEWMPSIIEVKSMHEWSEIGVIFLLFALGLEFSFKKLLNVGGAATITAVTEVVTMFCVGFAVGHFLGWKPVESVFLGGMLAMSSTTIIIKAFNDLGLRKQKFTTIVFGTLVVEDILGILMMVMLPIIVVSREFAGMGLVFELLKMAAFLVICYALGMYLLPLFFRKYKKWLNNETLLIIAIGLCFGLVTLTTHIGFSAALGAFIMGSLLAETTEGEHVEHLIGNIKDLFGAVFFVSVGMMVDPRVLVEHWLPVLVLTLVTIFGKSFFSTLGTLLSGQPLRTSIQSGFSLAQIGEFAFIIATVGYQINLDAPVLSGFIYPVIVAVSVITTFPTPYFIRLADPFYEWLVPRLSPKTKAFLDNYASRGQTDTLNDESDRRKLIKHYLRHFLVYALTLSAIVLLFYHIVYPFSVDKLSALPVWAVGVINAVVSVAVLFPFLLRLMSNSRKCKVIVGRLNVSGNHFNQYLVYIFKMLSVLMAVAAVFAVLWLSFPDMPLPLCCVISLLIVLLVFYASRKFYTYWVLVGKRVRSNLQQKEVQERKNYPIRTTITAQLSHRDIQFAEIEVSPDSPFVGRQIRELDLRRQYGINIVKITRGSRKIYFPTSADFIYPADRLMCIGTDEQILSFTNLMEMQASETFSQDSPDITLSSVVVEKNSKLLGKTVAQSGVRDIGCLIVSVERGKDSLTNPAPDFHFAEGDLIWIVGEKEKLRRLFTRED